MLKVFPDLGHFLEISLPTGDLGASLDFYRQLGFTEIPVNDVRPRGYAAVTDGQIVLGLYDTGLDEPALRFVRPDLARHARSLQDNGTPLTFQRLDVDEFNEVGLRTPDGQLLVLMEAATFTAGDDDSIALPPIGRCVAVGLATDDIDDTRAFFEAAGFLASEDKADGEVLLATPGLSLVLCAGDRTVLLSLRYEPAADGEWRETLESRGLTVRRDGGGAVLVAPEGLRLRLGA